MLVRVSFFPTSQVFGSAFFVCDLHLGKDKLPPRSIKHLFVGYLRTQKGYKCYNLSTRQWFTSADMVFYENMPFGGPDGALLSPDLLVVTRASHKDLSFPISTATILIEKPLQVIIDDKDRILLLLQL